MKDIQFQVLSATSDAYPETDAEKRLRSALFNRVALVRRGLCHFLYDMALSDGVRTEWGQAVAPIDEAVADYSPHRLVAVTHKFNPVDTGENRQWWAVLKARSLTEAAVVTLANECPGLIHVSLADCRNLTDAAIIALANGCLGLSSVECGFGGLQKSH